MGKDVAAGNIGLPISTVDAIRSFNRFYTRRIGLLAEHLPASEATLAEARVVYELAQREQPATELAHSLGMDRAHLSRLLARLKARDQVAERPDPLHGKRRILSLTPAGSAAFAALDAGTRAQIAALLAPVGPAGERRLVAAMAEIHSILRIGRAPAPALREVRVGDLGWITHRQGLLYHEEYGFDWTYEALVAETLGRYAKTFDPAREGGWVADDCGEIVGSVFLMATDDPAVARLRLLYVEPRARGRGVGRMLVDRCILAAREAGYARLTLWTNDILLAARSIYERAGFVLEREAPHRSFGVDLVGQDFYLELTR